MEWTIRHICCLINIFDVNSITFRLQFNSIAFFDLTMQVFVGDCDATRLVRASFIAYSKFIGYFD